MDELPASARLHNCFTASKLGVPCSTAFARGALGPVIVPWQCPADSSDRVTNCLVVFPASQGLNQFHSQGVAIERI